jgi:hypothetical protein
MGVKMGQDDDAVERPFTAAESYIESLSPAERRIIEAASKLIPHYRALLKDAELETRRSDDG